MDPLTQGVVGATAGQLISRKREKVAAFMIAGLSGMAPDLDVLIRSDTDPLLYLEYHRHFTHSLLFIPFGALLCALLFFGLSRLVLREGSPALSFSRVYLFAFAGYATHALLDACTTYGTQLWLPFTNSRAAWNVVSVIDPLFTLPILLLILVALIRRSTPWAVSAAGFAVLYLSLGLLQNHRAETVATQLALSRGHDAVQLGVKPSFANILLWKSVYQHDGFYYVDAIRVGTETKIYPGTRAAVLSLETHFPWLDPSSTQASDIERFRWFSNDHLGLDPSNPMRIIDVRYSTIPNRLDGLWGIEMDPDRAKDEHVAFVNTRPQGEALTPQFGQLWSMIMGR